MVKIKRIEIMILLLFIVVILIFSIFGEKIYNQTKPHVGIVTVTEAVVDGSEYILIPREAYFDGKVYVLGEKEGFFVLHTYVVAKEVQVEEIREMPDKLHVIGGVEVGELIVSQTDKTFADGEIVIVR